MHRIAITELNSPRYLTYLARRCFTCPFDVDVQRRLLTAACCLVSVSPCCCLPPAPVFLTSGSSGWGEQHIKCSGVHLVTMKNYEMKCFSTCFSVTDDCGVSILKCTDVMWSGILVESEISVQTYLLLNILLQTTDRLQPTNSYCSNISAVTLCIASKLLKFSKASL